LIFTISGEFDGTKLSAKYNVQPRGNKLTGQIEFDFNGESGELDVSGMRDTKKVD
jgi:hypothetical protein